MRPKLPHVVQGAIRVLRKLPAIAGALGPALDAREQRHESVGTMLEHNARTWPNTPAVRELGGETWTHAQLDAWSNRVAQTLVARGVLAGEPVGIWVENRIELLALVGGVAKAGAVAVMGNTNQRGRSLGHSLAVALGGGAHWIIADEPRRAALVELGSEIPGLMGLETFWSEVEESSSLQGAWSAGVRMADPFAWIFTSGTTGLPKASVMTHGRWRKAAAVYGSIMLDLSPADVLYCPLPLYHSMALVSAWGACVRTGACLAIRPRFRASTFWDDCREVEASAITYIGEVPRYLLAQPQRDSDREHGVRKALGVGLRPELWDGFRDRFGLTAIYEHYGASEGNSLFVNVMALEATVGFCPTPHALVAYDRRAGRMVRDGDGWAVRVRGREAGLLLTKVTDRFGFDGYTQASATREKLVYDVFETGDRWFYSGDLLRRVGFGHVQFVDRVGDTFRWKSENVATREVEAVLDSHCQVRESTVYGVAVEGMEGKAGMAALVVDAADAASFDWDALHALCTRELPGYARPVFVRLVASLELTGTFKHRRFVLASEGLDVDPIYFGPSGGPYQQFDSEQRHRLRAGLIRL